MVIVLSLKVIARYTHIVANSTKYIQGFKEGEKVKKKFDSKILSDYLLQNTVF